MDQNQTAVPAAWPDADIVAAVRKMLPETTALILFGSHASGATWAESDLDLAVLLPGRGDPVRIWEAGQRLAAHLKTDVDLVDLCAASTVLQYQVITTGRRLFAEGQDLDIYEMYILREMQDLNASLAPLMDVIMREGHVYGS